MKIKLTKKRVIIWVKKNKHIILPIIINGVLALSLATILYKIINDVKVTSKETDKVVNIIRKHSLNLSPKDSKDFSIFFNNFEDQSERQSNLLDSKSKKYNTRKLSTPTKEDLILINKISSDNNWVNDEIDFEVNDFNSTPKRQSPVEDSSFLRKKSSISSRSSSSPGYSYRSSNSNISKHSPEFGSGY